MRDWQASMHKFWTMRLAAPAAAAAAAPGVTFSSQQVVDYLPSHQQEHTDGGVRHARSVFIGLQQIWQLTCHVSKTLEKSFCR